jgi:hypothetical protein
VTARSRGPLRRRVWAWGGSLAPAATLGTLLRSPLLKRAVGRARATTRPIGDAGSVR